MPFSTLTFDEARAGADHLRALAEVRAAKPVGLVLLGPLALIAWLGPEEAILLWGLGLALGIGPFLVPRVLPAGTLLTYRLTLVCPVLNALLLALVVFLATARIPAPSLEDLPVLPLLLSSLTFVAPAFYLLGSFPWWIRRWRTRVEVSQALAAPPPAEVLARLKPWVEAPSGLTFRTVPPAPRNLRRFLRPDFTRHGFWHILLASGWALVVAADGSRAEAVPRGALKLVTDELEDASDPVLCLVRWNAHLHEGRIAPGDAQVLLDWITAR